MLGLILAVPLACVSVLRAAGDSMNSTREVGPFFVSFQVDQAIAEGPPLPLLGLRVAAVFQERFGLEGSASTFGFGKLGELSALAVIKLVGDPVLLRAGVSHVPRSNVHGFPGGLTGFHVGASLLSGDVDDRVRFRLDYTYRQFERQRRGTSSVGLGLVLGMGPD